MPTENNDYASKGVAGAGLGLGIAGTALNLMQNGALGNIFGGIGGGANAALANLSALVAQITKTVVPLGAVCPQPMPQFNSWTAPTTTAPAAAA